MEQEARRGENCADRSTGDDNDPSPGLPPPKFLAAAIASGPTFGRSAVFPVRPHVNLQYYTPMGIKRLSARRMSMDQNRPYKGVMLILTPFYHPGDIILHEECRNTRGRCITQLEKLNINSTKANM